MSLFLSLFFGGSGGSGGNGGVSSSSSSSSSSIIIIIIIVIMLCYFHTTTNLLWFTTVAKRGRDLFLSGFGLFLFGEGSGGGRGWRGREKVWTLLSTSVWTCKFYLIFFSFFFFWGGGGELGILISIQDFISVYICMHSCLTPLKNVSHGIKQSSWFEL